MCRYMIGFIAFNFILRIVFGSMMRIAFIVEIGSMDFYDRARYMTCFRIPAYMITDFK